MAKDPTIREYFDELAVRRGWDEDEKIAALFEYIGNQQDDECFIDFLDNYGSNTTDSE